MRSARHIWCRGEPTSGLSKVTAVASKLVTHTVASCHAKITSLSSSRNITLKVFEISRGACVGARGKR